MVQNVVIRAMIIAGVDYKERRADYEKNAFIYYHGSTDDRKYVITHFHRGGEF